MCNLLIDGEIVRKDEVEKLASWENKTQTKDITQCTIKYSMDCEIGEQHFFFCSV